MANTLPGTPYVESSDLVANYPAVSESLAERVDLVGILPFASSTARGTALPTPTDGQFSYLQDTNSTEFWNGSAWQALGGKFLQVVQTIKTDTFSTTSTSYVEVTGFSVSITPRATTSKILVIAQITTGHNVTDQVVATQLRRGTTGINLSATNDGYVPVRHPTDTALSATYVALDSPATTSATSYNVAMRVNTGTGYFNRSQSYTTATSSSTIIAIEVGA